MMLRTPKSGRRRSLGIALLGFILLTVWGGCSQEKRYRVLSFFFDGVPDPNAPVNSRVVKGQRAAAVVYSHKPYADGNCTACHTTGMNSIFEATNSLDVDAHVCLKCHTPVLTEHRVMHGPVTAIECLRCHAPHESNAPNLLAMPSPNVCMQCHVPELLSPNPPEHLDAKASCLNCHFGHGSERHGLLRSNSTTAPATAVAQRDGRQEP